jgi:hypothetical protein
VNLGGARGTYSEGAEHSTWPSYEARVLHHALNKKGDHYNPEGLGLDANKELAYMNQVTQDYKDRAAEVLQSEFKLWLQGRHPDNNEQEEYNNGAGDGRPTRRYFAVTAEESKAGHHAGEDKDDWISSPWGRTQLTHLHGVRDYLRADAIKADEESFKLNMLAEYGPQNLQDAWIYFKHWVKKRPIDDPLTLTNLDDRYTDHLPPVVNKSKGGNIQPDYRAYMRDDGKPVHRSQWPDKMLPKGNNPDDGASSPGDDGFSDFADWAETDEGLPPGDEGLPSASPRSYAGAGTSTEGLPPDDEGLPSGYEPYYDKNYRQVSPKPYPAYSPDMNLATPWLRQQGDRTKFHTDPSKAGETDIWRSGTVVYTHGVPKDARPHERYRSDLEA